MSERNDDIVIRGARVADVPTMADLINDAAEQEKMLHRSLSELYERLRGFRVADRNGEVVGVVGLRVMWANLAELYALAVGKAARGRGVGRRLVEAAMAEAERLGVRRVFALTYEQTFFEKCGFSVVDRFSLPAKVWSECQRCPKRLACDEIAMACVLEHVPDLSPKMPEEEPEYRVPAQLSMPRLARSPNA